LTASLLALTVFAATAVEMVEALTIVLAIGVSRGWRSTLHGAVVALAALILLIALFGSTIATEVPLGLLRLIVGLGLLVFGLQWLRKAVERAACRRPHRDEAATFDLLRGSMSSDAASKRQLDIVAFTAAFKGVFLEGLEAAIIIVTLGATAGQLPVAYGSGGVALVSVALLGAIVHRPLTRIPENTLKLGVGLLLSSFGTFWLVEGLGIEWPGSELAILGITAAYLLVTLLIIRLLSHSAKGGANHSSGGGTSEGKN
jgi:Ca2+/H+ antiporter, TMEM165/GDT1 family